MAIAPRATGLDPQVETVDSITLALVGIKSAVHRRKIARASAQATPTPQPRCDVACTSLKRSSSLPAVSVALSEQVPAGRACYETIEAWTRRRTALTTADVHCRSGFNA